MNKQQFKCAFGRARRAWGALMGKEAHFAHVQSRRALCVGLRRALRRTPTEREVAALNAAIDGWYLPGNHLSRKQALRALDAALAAGIPERKIETRDGFFYRV